MTGIEEPTRQQSRNRSHRPKPAPSLCKREGCTRRRVTGYKHCSFMCKAIDEELSKAQRLCELLGDSPITTELWTAVVTMADAWTDVVRLRTRLANEAASVGMTREQWQSISRMTPR